MRIGIDYTPALTQSAGIGRFTRELVRALLRESSRHSYTLVHTKGAAPSRRCTASPVRTVRLPFNQRMGAVLWHRLRLPLPLETFTGPLDVYHATDYLLPPLMGAKGIATVHDLSFLVYPELGAEKLVRYLRSALPRSLDRAALVLADSESSKRDLERLLGFSEERVRVVYGGVSAAFRPVTETETLQALRGRYSLHSQFILTLGAIEPRKNLVRLVRAYNLLRREHGIEHSLVIGGGKGWLYQETFDTVRSLGLEDRVRFLGFVPEDDLPGLLSLADLFVYPSLYEGFGLPPLEAMACGTPVVAGNASCLPEVLGEAAVFVDPHSVAGIADGILRLLSDETERDRLRESGLQRAKEFTWEASARSLLEAYNYLEAEVGA